MNDGDLAHAQSQYPETVHLFDDQSLRDTFAKYEHVANRARLRVRRIGLFAIASGSIALLSAATEPLWHRMPYENVVSIVFEICGLGAALVAGGSVWLGPWRKRWLEARFMTERLRQWHFQILVRRGREVEASLDVSNPVAKNEFKKLREQWFKNFLHDYEGKLDSKILALVSDTNYSGDWLHVPATDFSPNSPVLPLIFKAYQQLRFTHQYDYANHKLSEDRDKPPWQFLRWPPLRQEGAIRAVVSTCFVLALVCSLCIIVNREFDIKPAAAPFLSSLALSLAIIGVAMRTLQEGLGVTKDVERYRDYRGKVNRLQIQFDQLSDSEAKLGLMEEMELAVVDEMKSFLRTHRDAAFIL